MSDDAVPSFVVVCEARADYDIARSLADRVFCEEIDWIRENVGILESLRIWRGLYPASQDERKDEDKTDEEKFIAWKNAKDLAEKHGIPKLHGHFDGKRAAPDAALARRVLLLVYQVEAPRAVLFIRDSDGDKDRLAGLKQARRDAAQRKLPFQVLIGVAHSKRECGVLNGFEPQNEAERRRLGSLKERLSFDPCCQAERLNDLQKGASRNAKRVLEDLSEGDWSRERCCWEETPLKTLRERGEQTGLRAYLDDLQTRLVPCLRAT